MLTFLVLLGLAAVIFAFITFHPTVGGKADAQTQKKIDASPHWNGSTFQNLDNVSSKKFPSDTLHSENTKGGIMEIFFPPKGKNPEKKLPSQTFDKTNFPEGSFSWLGHSMVLMHVDGKKIMVDPVFFRASPIILGGKPFELENPTQISDLPQLDIVLISHDHYDHLDYKSIQKMHPRVQKFLVPLGVKAHLEKWGVPSEKISEFDWYQKTIEAETSFTLAPSRHFSGRGLTGQNTSLWGGWIIEGKTQKIYISGDGGYSTEFLKIGEKYGPFDIAFLENGAYNTAWADIHMFPEQSVQAGIDVNAAVLHPVHWGRFDLSMHQWTDPITRFSAAAEKAQKKVATPLIGETFTLETIPEKKWWEF